MKKALKINKLSNERFEKAELQNVKGGWSCGCYWANDGGSSTKDNKIANFWHNYDSIPR